MFRKLSIPYELRSPRESPVEGGGADRQSQTFGAAVEGGGISIFPEPCPSFAVMSGMAGLNLVLDNPIERK
jgi:hypothetical protein